jgi:hypothetical protein
LPCFAGCGWIARWLRFASVLLFVVGAAAATAGCLYLPMRFGGRWNTLLIAGTFVAAALAVVAATQLLRNRARAAAGAAIAAAVSFDVVLGVLVVPRLHDLWLSPRAANLVAEYRRNGDSPPVVTGYVEPSLVFLLGSGTHIAPASEAAAGVGQGGLVLVEQRALARFLAGVSANGLAAQPLGSVDGLDYSIGRKEQVTLYRVKPVQR